MKSKHLFYLSVFVVGLFSNCSVSRVVSDYDPQSNFQEFKTFVICEDDLKVQNHDFLEYDTALNRMRIKNALENEMQTRGYIINNEQPELQVGFKLNIEDEIVEIYHCSSDIRTPYWEDCKFEQYEFTEQYILVYVTDLAKDQIIWQGSLAKPLEVSPKRMAGEIQKVVHRVFKEYPI